MQLRDGTLTLSATDLARHLGCEYLTQLNRQAAEGNLKKPVWPDPVLEALRERGKRHEAKYQAHLEAQGLTVINLENSPDQGSAADLMHEGVDVIAQARLNGDGFMGYADFLIKIPTPSDLGAFSYEVTDTKLASETKAGTILQLSLYSELVGEIQGRTPDRMHVVRPGVEFRPETFRVEEYGAYYRLVRRWLMDAVASPDDTLYPLPCAECAVCDWQGECRARWRADDHLTLAAGMTVQQAAEFERQGITTLEQLGFTPGPLKERPVRGALATYERLREQARVQLEGRKTGRLIHERLPIEEGRGFYRLPAPSAADVFFDIEAARFHEDGGIEYLLGWCIAGSNGDLEYHHRWAHDRRSERDAFEAFIDAVMEAWANDPGMHVYHYTPYEPSALKRLMGRYGTRETQLDRLLRGGRLVDLYAVARQGIRASVERYSLKDLEAFAGYTRKVDLREASRARRRIEAVLDDPGTGIPDGDRDTVQGYNREDCEATAALRDWLEQVRGECIADGTNVPRPVPPPDEAPKGVSERDRAIHEVASELRKDLPLDQESWTEVYHTTNLLAEMLGYHRREANCGHWEFFRLHELEPEEMMRERKTITSLEFVSQVPGKGRLPVHRYSYPEQDTAIESQKVYEVGNPEKPVGEVVAHDLVRRTIDIKKTKLAMDRHPDAIMADDRVSNDVKAQSLLAFARSVAEHGLDGDGPFRAGRDLLLARAPRRVGSPDGPVRHDGEELLDAGARLVKELDHGLLAVQGPPGSGKTWTGARMILDLAGRARVGVTAVSHKVIRNLLGAVHRAAEDGGREVLLAHKDSGEDHGEDDSIQPLGDNDKAMQALDEGYVVGGTSWLWSRDAAVEQLDYLFVDEAGQMSMADVLAVSRSARNVILLGDPQQLEQPQQAAHPEGTDVAALVHMLCGHDTLPADKGLFLDATWRLHPAITEFTSEQYYEGRLRSRPQNKEFTIEGPTDFAGAGLFYIRVEHEGNQSDAPEEVEAIGNIVRNLLADGTTWFEPNVGRRPLRERDILIVAPYNAQVAALLSALPTMKIGTVDKFQGQEAAVVIYSVTSSSREDAPRGMRFLYDPHRFNVATSRAHSVVIVVGTRQVFAPDCHTPEQMRWANGYCRFLEKARVVGS